MNEDLQLRVCKEFRDRSDVVQLERVDDEGAIVGRELDQAQLGPIRAFPQELGVERESACGSDLSGGGLERRRIRDDLYGNPSSRAMSMRITSDVPSPISRILESRKCLQTGNSSM